MMLSENIPFRAYESVENLVDALQNENIEAAVYDAPTLRYYSHESQVGTIEVLPVRFQAEQYAIALPPGSDLKEQINRSLLAAIESEGWNEHVQRLVGR